MLRDELYMCRTRLAEGITDICFYGFAEVPEVFRDMIPHHMKWTSAYHLVPFSAGFINVFYKIGVLPDGMSNEAHGISLFG